MPERPFPELRRDFLADPLALLGRTPGLHLLHKPSGPTSHDMVAAVRRRFGLRRVGHGGTLDPLAEGLLLILTGNATRLFDDLQGFEKTYVATLRLGVRTDTQDITGRVVASRPERLPVAREAMEAALVSFRGDILQVPPMYSALKKDGAPLHKRARAGETVEREPRPVSVRRLELVRHDGVEAELSMDVSKGFYVRTLIDDLGEALGAGATMTKLVRTRIGPYRLSDAYPPDGLPVPPGDNLSGDTDESGD